MVRREREKNERAIVVRIGRIATIIMNNDSVVDLTADQDSSGDSESIDVEERE